MKLLCLLLLPVVALADWEVQRHRDDIKVYTREVPDSKYKEVRAVMRMQTPLMPLVGLVMDTDACPELAELCKEAYVVEQESESELYIYSYNDIPFPATDRDAVTRVNWTQDDAYVVRMEAVTVEGMVPATKAVRVLKGVTSWEFKPVGGGEVEITTRAHIDPGGPIPAFITNMLLVDTPFKTLKNMRRIIHEGRYQDAMFSFIEPVPATSAD